MYNTILPSVVPTECFNKSNKFLLSDSENAFNYNLKHQPADWQWRNTPISYDLNELGYRTSNFSEINWSESIVFFGCSLVFGIGVDDYSTIPSFVQRKTGINTVNLGVPAGSNYHSFYNSFILRNNYPTPKAIVFCYTSPSRYTVLSNDKKQVLNSVGPWDDENTWFQVQSAESMIWHLRQLQQVFRFMYKEINTLECSVMKNYATSLNVLNLDTNGAVLDRGRDHPIPEKNLDHVFAHPGPKTNEMYADNVIKHLLLS